VHELCDDFLADTRLANDEHLGVGPRGRRDVGAKLGYRWAVSDQEGLLTY
jgi:hypothetical protein